jgi:hypothetical protein
VGRTRRYIEDFAAETEKAADHTALYQATAERYPNRLNLAVL